MGTEVKYVVRNVAASDVKVGDIVVEPEPEPELVPEVGDFVEPTKHGIDTYAGQRYEITEIEEDGSVVFRDSIGDVRSWPYPAREWKLIKAEKPVVEPEAVLTPLEVQIGGSHYKDMAIQPLEYCLANAIPFAEGNIIKYVSRWRKKNGVQDLKKARHMLDVLIAQAEKEASA